MVSKKITVNCPIGLQVQPAGIICKAAVEFKSKITFDYYGGNANAKSMLNILGACIKDKDEIDLICDGEDEEEALEAIAKLLEEGLA